MSSPVSADLASTSSCSPSPCHSSRVLGSLLFAVAGDCLGAPVEGLTHLEISQVHPDGVRSLVAGPHMGLSRTEDRRGRYTDDSNAMLALADSLVKESGLKPESVAHSYAHFWSSGLYRGCPATAERCMKAIKNREIPYYQCGRISFPDGSFANGGAMRIAPVALAFHQASDAQLRRAVRAALLATHVHPESVDAAFILCLFIGAALKSPSINDFNPRSILVSCIAACLTPSLRSQLQIILDLYDIKHGNTTPRNPIHSNPSNTNTTAENEIVVPPRRMEILDYLVVRKLGNSFQLKSIEAVPCAIWIVMNYYRNAFESIVAAVAMGGDTDTIACMVGAVVGALHGSAALPSHIEEAIEKNEPANAHRGIEYIVEIGQKLSELDLYDVILTEEMTTVGPLLEDGQPNPLSAALSGVKNVLSSIGSIFN